MESILDRAVTKVAKRLVPFLIACYFVAYLDRVNVSFAALTMNQDLGLSQTAFGLGAGIFFIAYFISRCLPICCSSASARGNGDGLYSRHCTRHRARPRAHLLSPANPAWRGGGGLLSRHH